MHSGTAILLWSCLAAIPLASARELSKRSAVEPYAPYLATCPSQLIRKADSLSKEEKAYVKGRTPKASKALLEWLGDAWGCPYAEDRDLPKLAIALSGGGSSKVVMFARILMIGRSKGWTHNCWIRVWSRWS